MIDLYCERVDAGLLAEPLNAATNAFFLIAAWYGWKIARGRRDALALATLIAAIGLGSALFHLFATTWAQWLDVIPILCFQVAFLALYVRRCARVSRSATAAVLILFALALAGTARFPETLNGSLSYAPAALALLAIALHHAVTATSERTMLLTAAGIFLVSLTARTVDNALCESWPAGTHFIWHSLNALVLYLALRTYVVQVHEPGRPGTRGGGASRRVAEL